MIPMVNKISPTSGYHWFSTGVQFGSQGKTFDLPAVPMIFDTGGNPTSLPLAVVEEFFASVPGSARMSYTQ